ncbi:Uncharacterised protein [Mycobacteroides abscessus]|nr:Uncharacterised protein [Mycobacteroides abscessus]
MSRSVDLVRPPNPPVGNVRSRSHSVMPWFWMSRSPCLRWRYASGSVSAMRWPRER